MILTIENSFFKVNIDVITGAIVEKLDKQSNTKRQYEPSCDLDNLYTEFTVFEKSEDNITLSTILDQFSYPGCNITFNLQLTYSLRGKELEVKYLLINGSDLVVPIYIVSLSSSKYHDLLNKQSNNSIKDNLNSIIVCIYEDQVDKRLILIGPRVKIDKDSIGNLLINHSELKYINKKSYILETRIISL